MPSVHYTYYQPVRTGEDAGVHILIPGLDALQDYTYLAVYDDPVEMGDDPEVVLERLWEEHNRSDRPRGSQIRSMCAGDIVDLEEQGLWLAASVGWRRLEESEIPELTSTAPPGVDYPHQPHSRGR